MAEQSLRDNLDSILSKEIPGGRATAWNATDTLGTVYGWPEELSAKIIFINNDTWVAPILSTWTLDKAELSIHLRILQLYESVNRFALSQPPKLCVVCSSATEAAKTMATKIEAKIVIV
jgi:hypothetical protein